MVNAGRPWASARNAIGVVQLTQHILGKDRSLIVVIVSESGMTIARLMVSSVENGKPYGW